MAHVQQHPRFPLYRMKIGLMADFSGSNTVFQEVPIGVRDGVNKTYRLAQEPLKNSESVYKDGMYMIKGLDKDYTLSGKDLIFTEAPVDKAVITVNYKYQSEG
ncbi:hypothetical protein GZH47_32750 (plasmid) [Paenibacillus rhizovicinus]|uniref:Uncharacterized protein n=1 Tax=Paenibacillus rhizovicinus TaxID=2704463 RepID=A0A6C0PB06_9BACL|nr:hypothetical protein [Paenibacillus rhizovicinus]QHW35669.1 hypothetical protein GZH47_32750 [Paenibacillus rhizovicinus]